MTQPEIYLVRHGETEWNRELRYQGQWESKLTDQGQNQARAVGRRLAQELADIGAFTFQCSPLGRCRQTAGLICEMAEIDPGRMVFDDRLMEIHCGRWQGLTRNEVAEKFPEDLAERSRDPWNFEIPGGGESRPTLQARARDWLTNLGTDHPILTVSHGMIGRIIRGLYCDLALKGRQRDLAGRAPVSRRLIPHHHHLPRIFRIAFTLHDLGNFSFGIVQRQAQA